MLTQKQNAYKNEMIRDAKDGITIADKKIKKWSERGSERHVKRALKKKEALQAFISKFSDVATSENLTKMVRADMTIFDKIL